MNKYEDTAKLRKNISKIFYKKANNEKDKDTVQPTVINDMHIKRYASWTHISYWRRILIKLRP
jgi:hypothetical protein